MRFTAARASWAASAFALLLSAAASAQTTAPAPQQTAPAQGTSGASQAPLMTAPRPDDKPTTDPTASQSGVSGNAPSDEMQRVAPPAAPSVAAVPGSLDPDTARALIGKEVRTRDGQPVGAIKDFTLKDPNGEVDRIVLAPDEEVHAGKKLVSVPISMLRTDMLGPDKAGSPIIDLPAAELSRAPEFTYSGDVKTVGGKP
jgi:PRC-barrel domain.